MSRTIKVPKSFLEPTEARLIVSPKIKKLWAVQIDLLSIIDKICRKHRIRYSLDSGTLIGAMRHGGYVPWDDDVDVIMPRVDYEKFAEVVNGEISPGYFFQTAENSPGYYRPFARLLNRQTTAYLKSEVVNGVPMWKYPQGVFVDILIADNVPEDTIARDEHGTLLNRLRTRYWVLRNYKAVYNNFALVRHSIPYLYKAFVGFLICVFEKMGFNLIDKLFSRFVKELTRYNNLSSKFVAPYTARMYEILQISDFDNLIDVNFEYLKVKAFARYDEILTGQYGNWHEHVIGARAPMVYNLEKVEFYD